MDQFKISTAKKRQSSPSKAQSLLKEEIMQLQRELECQTTLRSALEKAMNCQPLLDDPAYKSLSKPAEDLIKEITLLELEVIYLEKYLLSLYRKSFGKKLSPLQAVDEKPKANAYQTQIQARKFPEASKGSVKDDADTKCKDVLGSETLIDSGIDRSQSSLSHYSACSFRASSPSEALHESLDLYHSLPQRNQDSASNANNLTESVGSSLRVRETPNYISEEMIRCISTIYCHLSDPPLIDQSLPCFSSPSSPPSFTFSPREKIVTMSGENPSFSSWANKPYHIESSEEFSESLFAMVEVVDIEFGPSRSREAAAYNIGGHTISIDTIQNSILGCRLPRPTQWLHSLFFPKIKFKAGDVRRSFAIKHAESRLRFALCSGCQSLINKSPHVIVHIGSLIHVQGGVSRAASGFVEVLEHSIPDELRKNFQKLQHGKLMKRIDWTPHNFSFGFLLSNELVRL